MDTQQPTLNVEQVVGILRRRAPAILLCFVLAAGAAYGFSKHQIKKYTATASLAFSYNSLSQQIAGLAASSSSSLLAQQASNLELVRLGDMAAKTASMLGHGLTVEDVAGSLSIGEQGESSVVDVSATTASPVLAAEIANVYTRQFVKEQQIANLRYFKSALAVVHKQFAALSRQQKIGGVGVELQDRAQTLGLLAELSYGTVQVAQEARAPSSPSSPKTKRNTILGGVLGLLLGLGVAFLLERFDRRIRTPEDLEVIYHLPMLGVVPKSAALSQFAPRGGARGAILPPVEAEAFSLIRAHLRFFNVDRDVCTVVVASPESGDGKTTVARHLAEAAARFGSRVLLLEVDLRHPTLAQQFNLQSGPGGLADVLIGAIQMDRAIQSVDLQAPPGGGTSGPALDVLAAGAVLPPNPGELLESRAMETLLARAKLTYNLVVIDTPPLIAVSDAFPLLTKVDGIVIVGRVGHSRSDAAEELHQILSSEGVPLLGVIANDSKSRGPSTYLRDGKSSPTVAGVNGASSSDEPVPTVKF